ncbi:MAG: FAD:protein FMN transferase [Clostridiales bacterium]|nr:FAD:protein FMN transferase [Clostridiales bacterium]
MKKTIFIVMIMAFLLCACSKETTETYSKSEFHLNTLVNVILFEDNEEIFDDVFSLISEYENTLSPYLENTEITYINNNAAEFPVPMSDVVSKVITESLNYSALSKGYFDITIGPLVDLWQISNTDITHFVPTSKDIENAKSLIAYKNIKIENQMISFEKNGMAIDLGAIAKGYITDQIIALFKERDISSAILNLGGNIFAYGEKADGFPYIVGIQDPDSRRGEILGTVKVTDKSIVTSGIYERFFELDGIIYHHILNPFTGYPEDNNLKSVTIVSDSSMDGDALSTTLFLLGLDEGIKTAEALDGIDAVFITKSNEVHITSGLQDNFQLTNENYHIVNEAY